MLKFDCELCVDGRKLPHPVNYLLVRIIPPPGVEIDQRKRPFVVVDPRAGHGPGIGGFKAQSEIGVALHAGHPCYFIGFLPEPVPGQTIEHIALAEAAFLERVIALHPQADGKPAVIGNCQAGWAVMSEKRMSAKEIERLLYHESGLKGLSGISNDVRDLLASPDPRAKLALDHFVYRISLFAGMLAGAMGGIDGMVENGYVTRDEGEKAKAQSLGVTKLQTGPKIQASEFFAEEARRNILDLFGEDKLYGGGLSVHATLDPSLQHIARKVYVDGLVAYDHRHGWRGVVKNIGVNPDWAKTLAALDVWPDIEPWRLAVVLEVTRDKAVIGLRAQRKETGGLDKAEQGEIPFSEMQWARPKLKIGMREWAGKVSRRTGRGGGLVWRREYTPVGGLAARRIR